MQFPAPRIVEEAVKYNNQKYMVENKHVYQSNSYYPRNPQNYQNNINYQSFGHQNYLPFPNADRTIDSVGQEESFNEETKRKRLASEETRVANGVKNNEFVDPRPRKALHRDETTLDYKNMLSNLHNLNPYNCR